MKTISRLFQIIFSITFLLAITSISAFAVDEVKDYEKLRKALGVEGLKPSNYDLSNIKIAVLDNSFVDYQPGKGMLPESTEVIKGPKPNLSSDSDHGTGMAQIAWAVSGRRPEGPKFYLVNTYGFSNFRAAIDFVIEKNVDIVLYSQTWDFGGNYDGTGFINAEVNRATARGIIWINAAGNDSKMIYNGLIDEKIQRNKTLKLGADKDYLRFENKYDKSNLKLTLSWTDVKDDDLYKTDKDLDLFVYNDKGDLIGSSEKIQRGEAPAPDDSNPKLSSYAREEISLKKLDRGTYHIKVVAKSDNFFKTDRLRILIKPEKQGSIRFTDRTAGYEIQPPADNKSVFTVGDGSVYSAEGPTLDKRVKPDVIVSDSSVSFTSNTTTAGSSDATAIIVGQVALLKALCAKLTTDDLFNYAKKLRSEVKKNDDDLRAVDKKDISSEILALIPIGGKIMKSTNGQLVILSPEDPLTFAMFDKVEGAKRERPSDIVTVTQNRELSDDGKKKSRKFYIFPARNADLITSDLIEFRRLRSEVGIWKAPKSSNACLKN